MDGIKLSWREAQKGFPFDASIRSRTISPETNRTNALHIKMLEDSFDGCRHANHSNKTLINVSLRDARESGTNKQMNGDAEQTANSDGFGLNLEAMCLLVLLLLLDFTKEVKVNLLIYFLGLHREAQNRG